MIAFETTLGTVGVSQAYFSALVSQAASECYGVAGMVDASAAQQLRNRFFPSPDFPRGVRVRTENGKLVIDLHIAVTYGVNISAIVRSIANKVRYTVEDSTGFSVARVNVFVDAMVSP